MVLNYFITAIEHEKRKKKKLQRLCFALSIIMKIKNVQLFYIQLIFEAVISCAVILVLSGITMIPLQLIYVSVT